MQALGEAVAVEVAVMVAVAVAVVAVVVVVALVELMVNVLLFPELHHNILDILYRRNPSHPGDCNNQLFGIEKDTMKKELVVWHFLRYSTSESIKMGKVVEVVEVMGVGVQEDHDNPYFLLVPLDRADRADLEVPLVPQNVRDVREKWLVMERLKGVHENADGLSLGTKVMIVHGKPFLMVVKLLQRNHQPLDKDL